MLWVSIFAFLVVYLGKSPRVRNWLALFFRARKLWRVSLVSVAIVVAIVVSYMLIPKTQETQSDTRRIFELYAAQTVLKLDSLQRLRVDSACDLKSLRTDSASGNQSVSVRSAVTASLDTASGKIEVTADSIRNLDIDSASGDVLCKLREAPDDGSIDTASGKVAVVFPEDAAFTLKLSTASGRLNSDFAMKKAGNTYVCGVGSGRMHIDTASGNVSLYAE